MLKFLLFDIYHKRRIVSIKFLVFYMTVFSIAANTDYVIATTNIITGQLMIQSVIGDTHDYQPCGPLFDQVSTGTFQKYFKPPESRLNIQQKAY